MDRARNQRLLKTYGISEAEYDAMLVAQGGGCKICGNPPKNRALAVEHDHRIPHTKIVFTREGKQWKAAAAVGYRFFFSEGRKRSDVLRDMKLKLLRASIRGLVDHRCNRGMQMFGDSPERLEAAAKYLREFYGKFDIKLG